MGPAFPSGMVGAAKEPQAPGCNGGVCYCNHEVSVQHCVLVTCTDQCRTTATTGTTSPRARTARWTCCITSGINAARRREGSK